MSLNVINVNHDNIRYYTCFGNNILYHFVLITILFQNYLRFFVFTKFNENDQYELMKISN